MSSEKILSSREIKADFERAFAWSLAAATRTHLWDDVRKFAGIASRVPLARRVRPEAYWQWKNGKLAPLYKSDFPVEDAFSAWDRSLGARVIYAIK